EGGPRRLLDGRPGAARGERIRDRFRVADEPAAPDRSPCHIADESGAAAHRGAEGQSRKLSQVVRGRAAGDADAGAPAAAAGATLVLIARVRLLCDLQK